jgi:hypothetical protein
MGSTLYKRLGVAKLGKKRIQFGATRYPEGTENGRAEILKKKKKKEKRKEEKEKRRLCPGFKSWVWNNFFFLQREG